MLVQALSTFKRIQIDESINIVTQKIENGSLGGIECSINRVGENYFDQLNYNGVYNNPEILAHILNQGIKTLRFPVLW